MASTGDAEEIDNLKPWLRDAEKKEEGGGMRRVAIALARSSVPVQSPTLALSKRAYLSSKSVTLQIRSTVPPGQSITQDVNTDAWLVYNGRGGTIHGNRD